MIFLTSPNNPDGSLTSTADVEEILKLPVLVVRCLANDKKQMLHLNQPQQSTCHLFI